MIFFAKTTESRYDFLILKVAGDLNQKATHLRRESHEGLHSIQSVPCNDLYF